MTGVAESGAGQPEPVAGRFGEAGHPRRVAQGERRLQIHEVAESGRHRIEPARREPQPWHGFGLEHRLPHRALLEWSQQLRRAIEERVCDVRIEPAATATADIRDRNVAAAAAVVDLRHRRQMDQPGGDADLLARQPLREALSVPPLPDLRQRLRHGGAHPQPGGETYGDAARSGGHL